MKIIAQTATGYLVDVSKDELATVQGMSWVDVRFKNPKAGDEIDINEVYSLLCSLTNSNDIKELSRISENCGKISNWLETYKAKLEPVKTLKYQSK